MSQNYAALIIDLKKSRSYTKEKRNILQHYVMETIGLLNRCYQREIVREVDFSAGDEIQGLFATPEAAYLYYRMFSMWLHPIEIRAGIGVGDWDVQIYEKGTTSQDGSVYHNARHAIMNADDSEGYPVLLFSGLSSDIAINTIIGGAATIMKKQSIYQNQLMLLVELLFPVCDRSRSCLALNDIKMLLDNKSRLDHEIDKVVRPLPFDRMSSFVASIIDPVDLETVYEKNAFYIISGKQRGIPTKLAEIMDISRQTIEKAIKAGNIYTARNMAIAAIIEMMKLR